jgi:hypothetical protein
MPVRLYESFSLQGFYKAAVKSATVKGFSLLQLIYEVKPHCVVAYNPCPVWFLADFFSAKKNKKFCRKAKAYKFALSLKHF